jgi:predicted nucleic acid-binding protein
MSGRFFADTNIIVYVQDPDREKSLRALSILESAPVLSTQVIAETINTLTTKFGFSLGDAHDIAMSLLDTCEIVAIAPDTLVEAFDLVALYRLSHWDSIIVAAALQAGCDVLYTEDLHHGLKFYDRLRVHNPFMN